MTDLLFDEELKQKKTDDGDHDKFAHYVDKSKLTDAMVFAKPLRALCGKLWVPTRDGLKFPVCQSCKDVYDSLDGD